MMTKQRKLAMERYASLIPDESKRLQFIIEKEQQYQYLVGKTEDEIRNMPAVAQYKAYDLGFIEGGQYTEDEILERKKQYLDTLPSPSTKVSVERWRYEVVRQFSRKDFHLYPDKIFLKLDTYLRTGSYS